ncbi:MAG: TonB-dependent receptor [Candidatus Cryptobacteroides sp.]
MKKSIKSQKEASRWCLSAVLTVMVSVFTAGAQPEPEMRVTIHQKNQPLVLLLDEIGRKCDCSFIIRDNDVQTDMRLSVDADDEKLETVLGRMIAGTGLSFQIEGRKISIFRPEKKPARVRRLSGTVTDNSGNPLIGAVVLFPGISSSGAETDLDGKFEVDVPQGAASLTVSLIGFVQKTAKLPDDFSKPLSVSLDEDVQMLDDVVVVGYGVQKKSVVTAAISSVKGDALTTVAGTRVDNLLKGMVSGVTITQNSGQPGSGTKVRIRGIGTINDSNPLYIVDGMPVSGSIDYLNPSDIMSVEILKDAASAAIYGARGANGVILVTTRQGSSERLTIDYSFSYGWQSPWKTKPVLDATEYAVLQNEMNMNSGMPPIYDDPQSYGKGTDWQKQIFNYNAPVVEHQASISGGTEKLSYYLSFGYLYNEGIIGGNYKRSNYDRYSVRANTTYTFFENTKRNWMRVFCGGVNMAYSRTTSLSIAENSERGSVLGSAVSVSPMMKVYADDPQAVLSEHPDAVTDFDGNVFAIAGDEFGNMVNPVASLSLPGDKSKSDKLVGNVFGELELYKGLKFRSSFGVEMIFSSNDGYQMPYWLGRYTYIDRSSVWSGMNRYFTWQVENTLSYNCTIADRHNLTVLIGQSAMSSASQSVGGTSYDLGNPKQPWIDNTESDVNSRNAWGSMSPYHRLLSWFGRISYNFDERYMAEVTLRRDGSSNFGPSHKWATFPSVSLGWNITNEPFMQNRPSQISSLKLRGSWGLNGNESIGSFHYMSTVISSGVGYILGPEGLNEIKPGAVTVAYPNDELKWEQSEQFNVGLDAAFFGNSLTFTFDWFDKRTNGMLMTEPLPQYIGNSRPYGNVGNMKNSGVEMDICYRYSKRDFMFEIGANATYVRNRVINLGNQNGWANYDTVLGNIGTITRAENGEPFPFFYGMRTAGIFQTPEEVAFYINDKGEMLQPDAKPGDVRFVDTNEDGVINDEDRVKIGKGSPDWILGANLSIGWKGIDLSVLLYASLGNDIFDASYRSDYPYLNMPHMLSRWTGPGSSDRIPRLSREVDATNWQSSDLYVHDASFLRLRNLQLGYTLPEKWMKKIYVHKLRFYAGVENLFTVTRYEGFDPEIASGGTSTGVDRGVYPTPRTVSIGAQVTF